MPNLAEALFARARDQGDKTALIFGEQRYSFADLAEKAARAAGGLAGLGVGPGTRVGLIASSSPDFIVYQQAIFILGAVFTPLNALYRRFELAHAIESCGLEVLILEAAYLDRLNPPEVGAELRTVLVLGEAADLKSDPRCIPADAGFLSRAPMDDLADTPSDAVGMMLNTSATTGRSKAVMLSLASIIANYGRTPEWLGLTSSAVTLCALPLYNTFGLNQGISALMVTGATMVLLPRFDAEACIREIEAHRCTFLPAVPTMLQKIVDHPLAETADLSSISRIMTGGAPVPSALLGRVHALMGPGTVVLTGYGLTEATALVSLDTVELGPDGEIARRKSIGRVLDGMSLKIIDAEGDDARPGEVGEILVRGPNVMLGYRDNPEATSEAFLDGWLRTGDLGYLSPDGCAYIVDRKKDVIIRGGQNVYPADIEEALYRVPGVAEACVVAQPHAILGETPAAFVAPVPGATLSALDLIAHCKADLAPFNVPSAIYILDELPKGPTGKILSRELRARLAKLVTEAETTSSDDLAHVIRASSKASSVWASPGGPKM